LYTKYPKIKKVKEGE
jgi:hypothetical protein